MVSCGALGEPRTCDIQCLRKIACDDEISEMSVTEIKIQLKFNNSSISRSQVQVLDRAGPD